MARRQILPILWFVFLSTGPIANAKGVHLCFESVRAQILEGDFFRLPALLSELGLAEDDLSGLPRQEEMFTRSLPDSFASSLDYLYFVKTKTHKIDMKFSFSTPTILASDSSFHLSIKWMVEDLEGRPVRQQQVEFTFKDDSSCSPKPKSSVVVKYERLPSGLYRLTTRRIRGDLPAQIETKDVTEDLVLNERQFANAYSVSDLPRHLRSGQSFQMQSAEPGLPLFQIRTGAAPPRIHMNPWTNKVERLVGVAFSAGSTGLVSYLYQSAQTPFRLIGVETAGGLKHFFEVIPKDHWLSSPIPEKVRWEQEVTGFTSRSFTQKRLRYRINGQGPIPKLFNIQQYVDVLESKLTDDGWQIDVKAQARALPQAIPWASPATADETPYLKSTKYVELEAVEPIAAELRPLLEGRDRLEASVLILNRLKSLLRYDTCAVNDDSIGIQTTKELLTSGKGVCQHFASLFTAIARSVGIPARMVSGFMLTPKNAISHAWVEVKVNRDTWWPLEPQQPSNRLDDHSFFPIGEQPNYEVPAGASQDVIQAAQDAYVKAYAPWIGATFTKSSLRAAESPARPCHTFLRRKTPQEKVISL